MRIVPLARQSLQIVSELQRLTGSGTYLFPSPRSARRALSNNALCAALRRMGYERGAFTVHAIQSTATTWFNERGFDSDWIERQLAQGERNNSRSAYDYADFLPQRKRMMQAWADALDHLRSPPAETRRTHPSRTGAVVLTPRCRVERRCQE